MSITVPHRFLIAPSGFKESLDSTEVGASIARGIRRALPGARIETLPMVDGGEGTASALARITGGTLHPVEVTGPVGLPVASHLALLGGTATGTAVVEMAAAAGLRLVPRDLRDPTTTTTRGVGELLLEALDLGARRIIVGCGDSGTSDGGAGLVQALGGRILDEDGHEIGPGGGELVRARRLDLRGLDPRVRDVEIVVACNMHNVLTGERGVARVFGPQKGASQEQVEQLERGLEGWAALLTESRPPSRVGSAEVCLATGPGTGASGGLGAALAAVCGAELRTRFDVLLDGDLGVDLGAAIGRADLVLTAEGQVDSQTRRGKIPAEVARRAGLAGVPVIALAGSIGVGASDVYDAGIGAVMGIIPLPMDLEQAINDADDLIADASERALRLIMLGAGLGAPEPAAGR